MPIYVALIFLAGVVCGAGLALRVVADEVRMRQALVDTAVCGGICTAGVMLMVLLDYLFA